ncbi:MULTISPECIES: enoyl-CoA hydratase [unclassified Beijerinckia]|uniref:enoyl-CoA hydratase n=1 Tax=unclassified Beijerinckia TaxID=2638183 RepID=UPI00089561AA|nr:MULTISPECIES: enoyl-CoA hydratase [unclassified Beijerinckia]MDH7795462.1 enoyl-CoA hydratase/carnithine racemase [Beijerinckia sp. GAS462]SEC02594.1 Enoyl-CoA hydratase/carnithine racemase [Beijerinckia sp. 28-YEA-48]
MVTTLTKDQANAPAAPAPLRREDDGSVALLTLNDPQRRNALSLATIAALQQAFDAIAADDKVRVVILAAEGPAFSAGHDLKELTAHRDDADGGRAFFEQTFGTCATMMQAIVALPQPVIAAIEGVATAAGCQMVAACDLAIASDDAQFATPGVNIGLFCSTPMVALSRNVSRKHAMEMLLTGELIDASEAARIGLVNRMVPKGAALTEALALAHKIAEKPRSTITLGKRAFARQLEMPLAEAYAHTSRVIVENMLHADAAEGVCAFIEKRAPRWGKR